MQVKPRRCKAAFKLTASQARVIRIRRCVCVVKTPATCLTRYTTPRPCDTARDQSEISAPMARLSNSRWFLQVLALAGFVYSTVPGFANVEPQSPDISTPAQSDTRADSVPAETNPVQSEVRPDSVPVKPIPGRAETVVDSAQVETNPSITLKASVWRTKPGIVFLKTPIGLLTLSSKTTLKDFLASQDVFFWIHDTHLAVEIRKRSNDSLVHRYLSGPFKRSGSGENKLLRWTPEGERSFDFGAHERSLAALREGNPVTVEVDDNGTVI